MTHKEFSIKDDGFRKACRAAGVEPTTRQAAKYRAKKGLAYNFKHQPKNKWFNRQVRANLKALVEV